MQRSTDRIREKGPEQAPEKRALERFFGGPFAKFIGGPYEAKPLQRGFSPFIILFKLALLIPFIILAVNIQPLSRSEEGLPSDHPMQRLWTIYGTKFPVSANTPNTNVYVYWGIDGMNMDGVNLLRDTKNKGSVDWNENFAFDEACQTHIYNVCNSVKTMTPESMSTFLSRDVDSPERDGWLHCPVADWRSWLLSNGKPFPLPIGQVKDQMKLFLEATTISDWGATVTYKDKWKDAMAFDGNTVRMVMITVRSHLAQRASHTETHLKDAYENFDTWITGVNAGAPASAGSAIQTSDGDFNGPLWQWMHTQSVFATSAVTGASMGVVLAFVIILLFTQEIVIAVCAALTILAILMSVLAMMKAADYELGTITAIAISILAGFAVDFVVHLAHSYAHCPKPTRAEKVQHVFDEIAVSVFSGALTSVLAAIVLLFCTLQFFAKFGFFLIFTVSWSWVWGNFFFMSLMRLIGPDESYHWIARLPGSVTNSRIAQLKAKIWPQTGKSIDTE